MRGGAAQRAPRLRQRRHLFRGRARLEPKSDLDGFLYGEIAGRPGVAMAQAKQQIDIGGPRTDAVQCRQLVVRNVGVFIRQRVEIEALRGDFARETFQGLDLGRGQSEPAEALSAGAAQRIVMKRIECSRQARPDRGGAGSRRSAGMPESSKIGCSRGSCLTSAWMAASRSAWVLRWTVIAI
jgi:hypothetical protein